MSGRLPPFWSGTGYLPNGWHAATLEGLKQRCVDEFPPHAEIGAQKPDAHRFRLFNGYMKLHAALAALEIPTEQWIGGSFATAKQDPADVDVVNFCDARAFEALPAELRTMLMPYFAGHDTARHCNCDSYLVAKGPPDHPCNADYLTLFNFWKKRFGHDNQGNPKGIIGINIEAARGEDEDHAGT